MNIWRRLLRRIQTRTHPSSPARWLIDWFGGARTKSGSQVTADTALAVSAVYCAVRVLAETIASLPLAIYRSDSDGNKEQARDHPLYAVLHDQANREQTAFEYREMAMGHLALRGNFYADIIRDNAGRVRELVPIHPSRITIERQPDGELVYWVQPPGGARVPVPRERIHHMRGLSSDGVYGLSPVTVARETIGLAMALEEYGARFFQNAARPSGVLEHPGKLSLEAHQRLRQSWDEQHGGLENAHRIGILEEGMKWHQLSMSSEDAQFIESRKFTVTEIARIFRIPPHFLGDLERATFSNIEEQAIEFVVYTLRPWLVRLEQAMNRDLLSDNERRAGYFVEHNVDGLLRGDIKARYEAYAIGRNWGWLSVNEIRARENMNRIDDGDIYLQPLNMTTPNQQSQQGDNREQQPQENQQHLVKRLLIETFARILRKEAAAIIQRDGKEGFWSDVERYYVSHAQFMRQLIMPVVQERAITRNWSNEQVDAIVNRVLSEWIDESKHDLLNAPVASVVEQWQNSGRAERAAQRLMEIEA